MRRIGMAVLSDGPGLAGAALVAVGAWQIYHPAGLIVGGMLLIAGAILRARGAE